MKASSELMKNNCVGLHVEQLDSLIKQQTRRVQGLATVKGRGKLLPWLVRPQLCPGRITVLSKIEHTGLQAARLCLPHPEEDEPMGLGCGRPSFLGSAQKCSQWQIVKSLSLGLLLRDYGYFWGTLCLGESRIQRSESWPVIQCLSVSYFTARGCSFFISRKDSLTSANCCGDQMKSLTRNYVTRVLVVQQSEFSRETEPIGDTGRDVRQVLE